MTMTNILRFKEKCAVFYRNRETAVIFVLKFLAGLLVFGRVNSVGYFREGFEFAANFFWTPGLAVLFAAAPPTAAHLILLLAVMIQISLSIELTLVVFLLGISIIIFYCRIQPDKSFLIIGMVLGFYFRIPYAVVLFAGLYAGFSSIVPIAIGTMIWNFLPLFSGLAGHAPVVDFAHFDVVAATDSLAQIYTSVFEQFTGDFGWVFSSFIFAMVIILIHAISRLSFNYSKEISLLLGGLLCIFGVIMHRGLGGEQNIALSIFFIFLSVALAQIVRFFDIALDYKKIEYVEFEDEDNFYYVKIINKLKSGDETIKAAPARPLLQRKSKKGFTAKEKQEARPRGSGTRARPNPSASYEYEPEREPIPRPMPKPMRRTDPGFSPSPSPGSSARPRPELRRDGEAVRRTNTQAASSRPATELRPLQSPGRGRAPQRRKPSPYDVDWDDD